MDAARSWRICLGALCRQRGVAALPHRTGRQGQMGVSPEEPRGAAPIVHWPTVHRPGGVGTPKPVAASCASASGPVGSLLWPLSSDLLVGSGVEVRGLQRQGAGVLPPALSELAESSVQEALLISAQKSQPSDPQTSRGPKQNSEPSPHPCWLSA